MASSNSSPRKRASFAEHNHVVVTGNVTFHERLLLMLIHTPFLAMLTNTRLAL